jgi:hypothetical protein
MASCGHPICELIGDAACSIASGKSRGCRPNIAAKVDPELVDTVRTLLAALATDDVDARRAAAVRLAQLVRREAREDRQLVALVRDEEPELAPELARLLARRSAANS